MQESLEYDYLFKYILIGDTSVGKTSLLSAYSNGNGIANGNSQPTMGVQFATKKVSLNGQIVKLQIWDTAGQQSFRTITRAYYKNAIGVILVYDLTNANSIKGLQSWLAQIQQNSNQKVHIVVVGNKKDLTNGSILKMPQSIKRFKQYHTSAKTGQNVLNLFNDLTTTIQKKIQQGQINIDGNYGVKRGNNKGTKLKLSNNQNDKSQSKCC